MNFKLLFFLLTPVWLFAQRGTIEGNITAGGVSVTGVTVSLKGTSFRTRSDQYGKFTLQRVPAGKYSLLASHLGYENFSIEVSLVTNETIPLTIALQEATTRLDEVAVNVAKQSAVQEAKPIAVRSVDIKDVIAQNVLVTDVADRLAGVRIRRSGTLGDKSDISINGLRGAAIRVYLDGLPMELVYPNFDVSTLPLGNIKRIDVYKGVLPVDIGSDAMGGAINIVTEQKSYNTLRASYLAGSFNTHMGDLNLGLATKKNFFVNLTGAINSSDNNYPINAFVFEKNRTERIKRFHDAYRMAFGSLSFGVHSKAWADELRISLTASGGLKELQNGARITNLAFGEVLYKAKNYTAGLKYEKTFWNERLRLTNALNYSYETLNYTDTTSNIYSWSGKIVGRDAPGEYFPGHSNNVTNGLINRSTAHLKITDRHALIVSHLFANQKRTGENFLLNDGGVSDYLNYPQYLTKNISGIQYEGRLGNKITVSVSGKYYSFDLDGVENKTFVPIRVKDTFTGYNVGLKYEINPDINVRTSYERGYLIPFFEQFVGNGANILRNTDLRPESSDNFNASVHFNKKISDLLHVTFNSNGFLREQYDVIFIGNTIFTRYENSDQVHTLGVDADLSLTLAKKWQLKANYTRLGKKFSKIKDTHNQYLEGTTFPNNPTSFGNLEVEWKNTGVLGEQDILRTYLLYTRIGSFNHMLIGQNDTRKTRPDLFVPVQNRVDAGLSYKFPKLGTTIAFNAINLLNAELFDNFSVPRAGRNFNCKIIYEINNF